MTPFFRIITADALSGLRTLETGSIQACVTSPPYYQARDYKTVPLVWDAVDGCEHVWGERRTYREKSAGARSGEAFSKPGEDNAARLKAAPWKTELGREPTPELYVAHMVQIFREVRRVLRDDGTCWINLGDCMNSAGRVGHGSRVGAKQGTHCGSDKQGPRATDFNLKDKDLIGIPFMVAFALRADGWYWRSLIPWLKRSGMPDSCRDRPGMFSVEYWLMLSKSKRYHYSYDDVRRQAAVATLKDSRSEATRNPSEFDSLIAGKWRSHVGPCKLPASAKGKAMPGRDGADGMDRRSTKPRTRPGHGQEERRDEIGAFANDKRDRPETELRAFRNSDLFYDSLIAPFGAISEGDEILALDIATAGTKYEHYACFSPKLVKPLVIAGSRPGDTILDPFSGTGSTGVAAIEEGRSYVGIEMVEDHADFSRRRLTSTLEAYQPTLEAAS